jgi:hypothetical protein
MTTPLRLPHPVIDCHVHVFDPVLLWDTPRRLFGFD